MSQSRKVPRSVITRYKVATSAKVRGIETNSITEARRIKKEKGSSYFIYYTDSKGYWAKEYPQ